MLALSKKDADWLHMWWSCGRLKYFGHKMYVQSQEIIGQSYSKTPRVMLLCDCSNDLSSSRVLLASLVAAATMVIAK